MSDNSFSPRTARAINHALRDGIAPSSRASRLPPWLADGYLASYLAWREQCTTVRRAYELWNAAEPADRGSAFAAFSAALDREERAALVLRNRAERVDRWLG